MSRNFYVLSYDIADDRRRRTVAGVMEGYGYRVQYSVFECRLYGDEVRELLNTISPHILREEGDSLRIYPLCASCSKRISLIGACRQPWEDVIVL